MSVASKKWLDSLTPEQREDRKARIRRYNAEPRVAEARRSRDRREKEAAIARYGGKCECCGESAIQLMTFDHVGGWGAEHRASSSTVFSIVKWLKSNNYPQDGSIRLLCWNCNCALGIFGFCHGETEP